MGREIKRVALDFDWPLSEVWEGFLIPDSLNGEYCTDCQGSGQTDAGWWLQQMCYIMAMLPSERTRSQYGEKMHPWITEFPHPHGHWEYMLDGVWTHSNQIGDRKDYRRASSSRFVVDPASDDIHDFALGIVKKYHQIRRDADDEYSYLYEDREIPERGMIGSSMGYSSNGTGNGNLQFALLAVLSDAAGVDFGCKTCNGEGAVETYDGQFEERDSWTPFEPPAGEGWQLWETVSEGSPITPVFDSAEALAAYLYSSEYSRDDFATYEGAMRFVNAGWAPTAIAQGGEVKTGAEYIATS